MAPGSPVKMVFFDIGKVLCASGFEETMDELAQGLSLSLHETHDVTRSHWIPYSLGFTDERKLWKGIKADLGLPHSVEELVRMPYTKFTLVPGTLELARRLSARGRVGIISNHSNEWSDWMIRRYGFGKVFRPIIISSRVGLRKPGLAIFERALREAGVTAGEALLIDDKRENVDAAERLGMAGIVFEGAALLRKELVRRGLLQAGP